jgi:hypothetical protein
LEFLVSRQRGGGRWEVFSFQGFSRGHWDTEDWEFLGGKNSEILLILSKKYV